MKTPVTQILVDLENVPYAMSALEEKVDSNTIVFVFHNQYQKDAAKIAEVQRGILATSQNEEPFDVFICYKESENDGRLFLKTLVEHRLL